MIIRGLGQKSGGCVENFQCQELARLLHKIIPLTSLPRMHNVALTTPSMNAPQTREAWSGSGRHEASSLFVVVQWKNCTKELIPQLLDASGRQIDQDDSVYLAIGYIRQ